MGHHYEVPPIYTPPMQTPPPPAPAPAPLPQPSVPGVNPSAVTSGGNGMVWCSGPQAPGWNVNLPNGGCSPAKSTVIHLNQLPYTGDSPIDTAGMDFLYVLAVIFGSMAIYRIIQYKNWI